MNCYKGSGSVFLHIVDFVLCDIVLQNRQHAYHPAMLDVLIGEINSSVELQCLANLNSTWKYEALAGESR